DAFRGDRQRVLDVYARQAILGYDGPVVVQRPRVGFAHVQHRFDGEHEAGFQLEIDLAQLFHAADDVVRNLRIFVHDAADAVADLFIEGDASAGGKRDLWILAGVTLEERRRPVARVDRLHRLVNFDGARAGLSHLAAGAQALRDDLARLTHQADLACRLQL